MWGGDGSCVEDVRGICGVVVAVLRMSGCMWGGGGSCVEYVKGVCGVVVAVLRM